MGLESDLTEFENCDPDNTQLEADLENKFHLNITKATQNPIMQITMEPIYSLLPRMRNYIYANIEGGKENTVKSHRKLLDAIREKNSEEAYSIMKIHLKRTQEIYDRYLKV